MIYNPLTNITGSEKWIFNKLQTEGFLPSEALKKIESERRLGIIPKDESLFKSENIGFYLALGAIGIGIIYIYLKSPTPTSSLSNLSNNNLNLYTIQGINLEALNKCKQKGLM